jgi:hypothetical protein
VYLINHGEARTALSLACWSRLMLVLIRFIHIDGSFRISAVARVDGGALQGEPPWKCRRVLI